MKQVRITTLADFKLRCWCADDESGCWRWLGGLRNGQPFTNVFINGKRVPMRARRAALYLAGKRTSGINRYAVAKPGCQHHDCVNPAHLRFSPRQTPEDAKPNSTAYTTSDNPGQKNRKLTPEQVATIRASSESSGAWARRLGVDRKTISHARRGLSYSPLVNSVFVLPASTAPSPTVGPTRPTSRP